MDQNVLIPKPVDEDHQDPASVVRMGKKVTIEIELEDYSDVHQGLIWVNISIKL